jgi:single-stranded-DNA-specific exonuclease
MSPVWHLLPRLAEAPKGLEAWHPLVWQACQRKGFSTLDALAGWLDPAHYQPASPLELPDLARATERIQQAVQRAEEVAVWGDFDVDGQTSTALLVSALRQLGLRVSSYIPNRMTEGHGVHVATLIPLIEQGIRLLITCDTGVDAHEAVEVARQHGVEVIITDHHKLPDALPDALAVVNPRRLPLDHPLRDLPGVGVAYKLAEALLPDASVYLDLVALGIVADVALLRGDTRYLLQQGLKVLHVTQRKGLLAMMEYAKISQETLDETTIAFQLAPRLNALGRLADANSSTEMLTTDDLATARRLANQLEGLNLERRRLSDEVWESVQVLLVQNAGWLRHAALVLDHPKWHTGVLGIVANRCVEHYHKPTVLLSSGADGIARGSARSIEGADITDAIAMTESLLLGYGGHTMAAGVSLQVEKINAFRHALSEQVRHQLGQNTTRYHLRSGGDPCYIGIKPHVL